MIRIGLLGTAKVAEYGLVKAAANTGEVALVAVAARDGGKAAHYAGKHGIAASYCGYQRLLDQPDIDAVYLPLSNHVHEEWAIKALQAQLDWGNGMTGAIHSSIWSRSLVKISLHVQGEHGSLHAYNPILPWFWNRITLKKAGKTVREKIAGGTTFEYQLRNFAEAVQATATPEQRLDDAVSNMRVIDEIYRKAGLPLR